ncbi:transposase, MuDR, plant [Tanacetum coccineum]
MFDANFLSRIYNGLPRDDYAEKDVSAKKDVSDEDNLGDQWPIHDPTIKWKLMRPVLGEKYESPEQLKRALVFYALANRYKIYYEVNNPRRLMAKCCRDDKDNKYPFSNWIAINYAKKIMMNPCIKVKEIIESILKKYKCKVKISQARRGKMKALQQYETCLEDHYGMLWSYASKILNFNPGSTCKMKALQQYKTGLEDHYGMLWSYASEILNSNPGSTCKISVDSMPDGKNYFSRFYVCFKGLREGWLQGCRRVIGLDGCFLKTICKGELLSAVGRDGNNQIYPIAWVVVSVENKDNWSWFMELLINDLGLVSGEGLTIISHQHKVMPLAEHRQCARHIYDNFRKKYTRVQYRNLFLKVAKATYPTRFNKVMKEIQKNRIFECFNAMIVDARRKPIINMLKDIREVDSDGQEVDKELDYSMLNHSSHHIKRSDLIMLFVVLKMLSSKRRSVCNIVSDNDDMVADGNNSKVDKVCVVECMVSDPKKSIESATKGKYAKSKNVIAGKAIADCHKVVSDILTDGKSNDVESCDVKKGKSLLAKRRRVYNVVSNDDDDTVAHDNKVYVADHVVKYKKKSIKRATKGKEKDGFDKVFSDVVADAENYVKPIDSTVKSDKIESGDVSCDAKKMNLLSSYVWRGLCKVVSGDADLIADDNKVIKTDDVGNECKSLSTVLKSVDVVYKCDKEYEDVPKKRTPSSRKCKIVNRFGC